MKTRHEELKLRPEDVKASVITRNGSVLEVDMSSVLNAMNVFVNRLNSYLRRDRDAINANEAQARVLHDTLPAGLPAAGPEFHGKLFHVSKAGVLDELHWCRKDAADVYAWVKIA